MLFVLIHLSKLSSRLFTGHLEIMKVSLFCNVADLEDLVDVPNYPMKKNLILSQDPVLYIVVSRQY